MTEKKLKCCSVERCILSQNRFALSAMFIKKESTKRQSKELKYVRARTQTQVFIHLCFRCLLDVPSRVSLFRLKTLIFLHYVRLWFQCGSMLDFRC